MFWRIPSELWEIIISHIRNIEDLLNIRAVSHLMREVVTSFTYHLKPEKGGLPPIQDRIVLLFPHLRICGYAIKGLDILQKIPTLIRSVHDLGEEENPLSENLRIQEKGVYCRIIRNKFTLSEDSLRVSSDFPAIDILRFIRGKVKLNHYDGNLSPEVVEELTTHHQLVALETESSSIESISRELLRSLVYINIWFMLGDRQDIASFLTRIKGEVYPKLTKFICSGTYIDITSLHDFITCFPNNTVCNVNIPKGVELEPFLPLLERFQCVKIWNFGNGSHVSFDGVYKNIRVFYYPVKVKSIPNVIESLPNIKRICVSGNSRKIPWHLLGKYKKITLFTKENTRNIVYPKELEDKIKVRRVYL